MFNCSIGELQDKSVVMKPRVNPRESKSIENGKITTPTLLKKDDSISSMDLEAIDEHLMNKSTKQLDISKNHFPASEQKGPQNVKEIAESYFGLKEIKKTPISNMNSNKNGEISHVRNINRATANMSSGRQYSGYQSTIAKSPIARRKKYTEFDYNKYPKWH